MADMIESNIRLFADETIMYLTGSNQTDCQALQSGLSKPKTWESELLMAFNPDKCEVIRITTRKKTTLFNYTLHGVGLKETDTANYQSPLILTELFQHNLINVSYLTACYLYRVMMTLHFFNDVAYDAESTQTSKLRHNR